MNFKYLFTKFKQEPQEQEPMEMDYTSQVATPSTTLFGGTTPNTFRLNHKTTSAFGKPLATPRTLGLPNNKFKQDPQEQEPMEIDYKNV